MSLCLLTMLALHALGSDNEPRNEHEQTNEYHVPAWSESKSHNK